MKLKIEEESSCMDVEITIRCKPVDMHLDALIKQIQLYDLNIAAKKSVRSLLGRRLEAMLDNGEKLIVNRHYVPAFKTKFGLEETSL